MWRGTVGCKESEDIHVTIFHTRSNRFKKANLTVEVAYILLFQRNTTMVVFGDINIGLTITDRHFQHVRGFVHPTRQADRHQLDSRIYIIWKIASK
jgi:hypothetical protein